MRSWRWIVQNHAINLKNGLKRCDLVPRLLSNLKKLFDKFSFDSVLKSYRTRRIKAAKQPNVSCTGVFQLSVHPPEAVDPPFFN